MNHLRGLYVAKQASENSDYIKNHMGCALIYRKYILGVGWNSMSTSPTQKKYNFYRDLIGDNISHCVHAEIRAIDSVRHFDTDWSKVTIYIYREWADGSPAIARPCEACLAKIRELGIKWMVYSNKNSFGYSVERVVK